MDLREKALDHHQLMANVNDKRNTRAHNAVREISPEAELICSMIAAQMYSFDNRRSAESDEGSVDRIKEIDLAASMVETVIDEDTNSNNSLFCAIGQDDNVSKGMSFLENRTTKPRLRHLDLEHDEHLLRIRLLEKRLETEEINYKIATRKLQIMETENRYRIALLKAQIAHLGYRNAVVAKVE